MNETIYAQFKQARIAKGWTQRELAERTGISQRHIERIEAGYTETGNAIPFTKMQRGAEFLGMRIVLLPETDEQT